MAQTKQETAADARTLLHLQWLKLSASFSALVGKKEEHGGRTAIAVGPQTLRLSRNL